MSKLYVAYGSNINIKQMADRCPMAKVKGKGKIYGWKLEFRGIDDESFATIAPMENEEVPVLLWEIEPVDEEELDKYEEYPELYKKEMITAICDGEVVEAMVYIMNEGKESAVPSSEYYNSIKEGYRDVGFEEILLETSYLGTIKK